jgi:hypothetical protein
LKIKDEYRAENTQIGRKPFTLIENRRTMRSRLVKNPGARTRELLDYFIVWALGCKIILALIDYGSISN